MTEDEMVGWYHRLNGHEFAQALGDGEQRSLACCSPWGRKESDKTELLNNNNYSCLYVTAGKAIALIIWTFVGKVTSLLFNAFCHKFAIALRLAGLVFLQSKLLSRVFSNTTVKKHQFFNVQPSLWSNSHIYTRLLEKP